MLVVVAPALSSPLLPGEGPGVRGVALASRSNIASFEPEWSGHDPHPGRLPEGEGGRGLSRSDQTSEPSIRWEADPSGVVSGVSVVGLAPETVRALADPALTAERLASAFAISIDSGDPRKKDRPNMLGNCRVEADSIRFTPRYPFDRGRSYSATFRPSALPGGSGAVLVSIHAIPKIHKLATIVTKVTPSTELVPENLLKFYLSFSAPMSRGEVYDRVRLLKEDGKPVELPFLRLGEELWDPTGTRLTLLIDPGRIKRGLRPREEVGPVLEAGRRYTLAIDRGWPDADGEPLARDFRKSFRAGPADEAQPDPKTWTMARPSASTRDPFVLTFPEPLDRGLLASALTLVDPKGEPVDGRLEIVSDETRWEFRPDAAWVEGDYQLLIDADLEDLAGNSILRPFEVDVQRDTPLRPEARTIRLPIAIGPKAR